MKCALCGHDFDEKEANAACGKCPMTKGCGLIKCPNCGFETPPEPRLPAWFSYLAGGQARWANPVRKVFSNGAKYLKKKGE